MKFMKTTILRNTSLLFTCLMVLVACESNNPDKQDGDGTGTSGSKRSYIPEGWYADRGFESYIEAQAEECLAMGAFEWIERLEEEGYAEFGESFAGIHVIDNTTFERVIPSFTSHRPSNYYNTLTFTHQTYDDFWGTRTYTTNLYFFFSYPEEKYQYKVMNGVLYIQDEADETETWRNAGECSITDGVLKGEFFYHDLEKVNYGKEWWED